MKLYHGSNMRGIVPDLSRSKPFKDFGSGFYLSDNYGQAMDLARSKVEQMRIGEAVVNEFFFDETFLLPMNYLLNVLMITARSGQSSF